MKGGMHGEKEIKGNEERSACLLQHTQIVEVI
jgi:hypothetical protein